jgi:hypothetical protein
MKSHEYSKYSSLRVATIQSGIPDPRSGNGGGWEKGGEAEGPLRGRRVISEIRELAGA